MEEEQKELTADDFYAKYTLIKNHITDNAPYDGCMFETYSPESDFIWGIFLNEPGRVWTIIDCDGWNGVIAGFHWVNRIGFLVTEEEWKDHTEQYTFWDDNSSLNLFGQLSFKALSKIFKTDILNLTDEEEIEEELERLREIWSGDFFIDERERLYEEYKNII